MKNKLKFINMVLIADLICIALVIITMISYIHNQETCPIRINGKCYEQIKSDEEVKEMCQF